MSENQIQLNMLTTLSSEQFCTFADNNDFLDEANFCKIFNLTKSSTNLVMFEQKRKKLVAGIW
jgi:hypothetical protein